MNCECWKTRITQCVQRIGLILAVVCLTVLLAPYARVQADDALNLTAIRSPKEAEELLADGIGKMCAYEIPYTDQMYTHHYEKVTVSESGWLIIESKAAHGAFGGYNARSATLYYDQERQQLRHARMYSSNSWLLDAGTYYIDFSMAKGNTYSWYGYFLPLSASGVTVTQKLSSDGKSVELLPDTSVPGVSAWLYTKASVSASDVCGSDSGHMVNTYSTGWDTVFAPGNGPYTETVNENGTYTFLVIFGRSSDWYNYSVYTQVKVTDIGRKNPTPAPAQVKKYKVTFQANGGKAVKKKLTVTYGSKYGTLPKTSRSGYKFLGWYTKKSGGQKVTASTKFKSKKNVVLYAHWKKEYPKLNKTKLTLIVGKTAQLKVTGTGKKVQWKTSNSAVATVKNGKVTAKKAGSAVITAAVDSKKLTCKVTVRPKPAEETPSQSVGTYNRSAAAAYAVKNAAKLYNGGKGEWCAGFVSKCVKQGGLNITYRAGVKLLGEELLKRGFRQYRLTNSKLAIYAKGSAANQKIAVGDVVIYYCQKCSKAHWKHAAIVTKIDSKTGRVYITDTNIGHSVRVNGKNAADYKDGGGHNYSSGALIYYLYHYEG